MGQPLLTRFKLGVQELINEMHNLKMTNEGIYFTLQGFSLALEELLTDLEEDLDLEEFDDLDDDLVDFDELDDDDLDDDDDCCGDYYTD